MDPGIAAGASGYAAVRAALVQAVRASGVLIRLEPDQFLSLLPRVDLPLVVHAKGGVFRTSHKYLTPYRGLVFFTKSSTPLELPDDCERVESGKMWLPQ